MMRRPGWNVPEQGGENALKNHGFQGGDSGRKAGRAGVAASEALPDLLHFTLAQMSILFSYCQRQKNGLLG